MNMDYNFKRLAQEGEKTWDDVIKRFINELVKRGAKTKKKDLEWLCLNYYALPNSPALLSAGKDYFYASACSSYPIYDTMHDHNFSIVETLKIASQATKAGIGCGYNFSRLRSKDEPVKGKVGLTGGPVSFLKSYDGFLREITQATRKSANMGLLNVNHPDIYDYIDCKKQDGDIACFNLSVVITDDFMEAVKVDKEWFLPYKTIRGGREIKARELFEAMAKRIWDNGEPGIMFGDTIRKDYFEDLDIDKILVNPCSEAILTHDEDWLELCVLASINLPRYMNNSVFDKARIIKTTVSMLNDIIDIQDYVTDWQKKGMQDVNRKLGIGVAGFATILAQEGIKYSSQESYEKACNIFSEIGKFAMATSGGRNKSLLSVAPTSTLSNIFDYVNEEGCSYGIEPYFSLEPMTVKNSYGEHKVEQKIVKHLKGKTEHIECANDLDYQSHLRPLEAYYNSNPKGVVQGCSKTINFKNNVTVEDVKDAIFYCWEHKIKAVSFYRDGSRKDQVMNVDKKKENGHRPKSIIYQSAPKRPESLSCDIFHTQSEKKRWIVLVSLFEDNPYEVFIGKEEKINIPKKYDKGIIEKNGTYNLKVGEGDDELVVKDIPGVFENKEHATMSRLISMGLRHGVPLKYLVQQLLKDGSTFDVINKAIARMLKKYIPENEESGQSCPKCKTSLVYIQGCPTCRACGYSHCS